MKEKSKVVIIRCDNYDEQNVYKAVKSGIDLLGGINAFVKPDEKLLIKPNLLKKSEVERAVITHPSVINAVSRLVTEAGIEDLSLGDSCGFGRSRSNECDTDVKRSCSTGYRICKTCVYRF